VIICITSPNGMETSGGVLAMFKDKAST